MGGENMTTSAGSPSLSKQAAETRLQAVLSSIHVAESRLNDISGTVAHYNQQLVGHTGEGPRTEEAGRMRDSAEVSASGVLGSLEAATASLHVAIENHERIVRFQRESGLVA